MSSFVCKCVQHGFQGKNFVNEENMSGKNEEEDLPSSQFTLTVRKCESLWNM